VNCATTMQMGTASAAGAGGGERHTGCKLRIRLFKGHEAFMPIGRRVGPCAMAATTSPSADRGATFAMNEEVDVWHAAHAYPM
jgi:hypothetical protein